MAAASKTIRIRLAVETDGEGKIKALGVNAKDFAETLKEASKSTRETRTAFEKWGTTAIMVNNISNAVASFNAVIQNLSASYAFQEQAETRLTQAMRNTMDATDAEIQSIKDLCSAQQQLGVIGDEVLLQGAQELAMHLNNADSLKDLIPVMNDVITQQYGIGASGESAANVGKMLGKVMEGNVTALKRLGISLNDADKRVLELGTEEERAATLARVLEERFGGMAEAAANTASGRMAQLNNTIGDIKESMGKAIQGCTPFITVLGSIGQSVMSVSVLYKGFTGVLGSYSKVAKGAAASTKILGMSIKSLMISTGVGIAIVALTTIITKLATASDEASESATALKEAEEAGNRAAANAVTRMREQRSHLEDLIKAHKDTTSAVQELNDEYGDIIGTYKTASEWIDALSTKERAYARVIAYRGKQQALAAKIAEKEIERDKLRQQQGDIQGLSGVRSDGYSYSLGTNPTPGVVNAKGFNANDLNYNSLENQIRGISSEIEDLEKEVSNIDTLAQSSIDTLKDNGTPTAFDASTASVETLDKRLKELQKTIDSTERTAENADKLRQLKSEYQSIKSQKDAAESYRKGSDTKSNKKNKSVAADLDINENSVDYANKKIAELQGKIEKVDIFDHESVKELQQELEDWVVELKNRKVAIGLETPETPKRVKSEASIKRIETDDYFSALSLEDLRQSFNNAKANADQIKEDFYNGFIDAGKAQELIDDINAQLQSIGLKPLDLEVDIDSNSIISAEEKIRRELEALQERMRKVTELSSGIAAMGTSFSQLGEAIGGSSGKIMELMGNMAQGIAQLLPQIMTLITAKEGEAIASGTASAAQAPWFMVIPTIASIIGTIIGTFASIPKFADGGIAYGPTLGLFGEYAGASNNPEVVAPLDRLKDLVKSDDDAFNGTVVFDIKGRKLVGLLKKEKKLSART